MSDENHDDELDELFSFGSRTKGAANDSALGMSHETGSICPAKSEMTAVDKCQNDILFQVHDDEEETEPFLPKRGGGGGALMESSANRHEDLRSRDFLEWLDHGGRDADPPTSVEQVSIAAAEDTIITLTNDDSPLPSRVKATSKVHVDDISNKEDYFDFEADIWGETKATKHSLTTNMTKSVTRVEQHSFSLVTPASSEDMNTFSVVLNSEMKNVRKPLTTNFLFANDEIDGRILSTDRYQPSSTTTPRRSTTFSSLNSALLAPESTATYLRGWFKNNEKGNSNDNGSTAPAAEDNNVISPENRKHLYVKLLCNNKSFDEVRNSSLAFSYVEWSANQRQQQKQVDNPFQEQATILSHELCNQDEERRKAFYSDLVSLLNFFYLRTSTTFNSSPGTAKDEEEFSQFIPTVTAILLSILESAPVTSVVIQSFLHQLVPILPLTVKEQANAAQNLAKYFYLLCLFHIPVVVMHLDRYLPGWYCPKIILSSSEDGLDKEVDEETMDRRYKNPNSKGLVPLSWYIAYFAGNLTGATTRKTTTTTNSESSNSNNDYETNRLYFSTRGGGFPSKCLIHLWDMVLLQPEGRLMSSLKFFIALQILDQRAHEIMQIRDSDSLQEFLENQVFTHLSMIAQHDPADDTSTRQAAYNCTNKALELQRSTPVSFLSQLSTLDDEIVRCILRERQKRTLCAIKGQLEEEARTYKEREKIRMKEEELQINEEIKNRLRVYYQKINPEKATEASLDNILSVYNGRVNDLNQGLASKYGAGFLTQQQLHKLVEHQKRLHDTSDSKPGQPLKDKYPESAKLLRLVHHPNNRKKISINRDANQGLQEIEEIYNLSSTEDFHRRSKSSLFPQQQVALQVAPAEVLPRICASKADHSSPLRGNSNSYLKSFLIDSRPKVVAKSQGWFPTAASLPPETLLDPDLIQKEVDRFESFRGSVHLVIMGEGIGSIPVLYGHALTANEERLAQEDYSPLKYVLFFLSSVAFLMCQSLKVVLLQHTPSCLERSYSS